jgi:hypothetical protein
MFLTALTWSVVMTAVRELNSAGEIFSFLFLILVPMLDILPAYEA